MGVLDAGNDLDLLVDEVADVGVVIDIELHQEIVIARGGVDFRGNLGLGERVGDGVGLAELAFELDEEGNHRCCLREGVAPQQYSVFRRGEYRFVRRNPTLYRVERAKDIEREPARAAADKLAADNAPR